MSMSKFIWILLVSADVKVLATVRDSEKHFVSNRLVKHHQICLTAFGITGTIWNKPSMCKQQLFVADYDPQYLLNHPICLLLKMECMLSDSVSARVPTAGRRHHSNRQRQAYFITWHWTIPVLATFWVDSVISGSQSACTSPVDLRGMYRSRST